MRISLTRRYALTAAAVSFAVLLTPEAALAFCVEDGLAGHKTHILTALLGGLVLSGSAGAFFAVLHKARDEERPEAEMEDEAYQLPAKAVTS